MTATVPEHATDAAVHRNYFVYVLPGILGVVLLLLMATAWWKDGPNLASAYFTVGAGLVGLVVNPQQVDKDAMARWHGLVILAVVTCVVTCAGMIVHAGSPAYAAAGAAFMASLSALAGLFINSAKIMPGSKVQ